MCDKYDNDPRQSPDPSPEPLSKTVQFFAPLGSGVLSVEFPRDLGVDGLALMEKWFELLLIVVEDEVKKPKSLG